MSMQLASNDLERCACTVPPIVPKSLPGSTRGIQNRPKIVPGIFPGRLRSTQGPPELATPPPGRPHRAQKAARRTSPAHSGRPKIAPRDPRERPRSEKNVHLKRFYTKEAVLPFFDGFFVDFGSFFEGAEPCFVWPGPHESHFSIFRKSREKSHRK